MNEVRVLVAAHALTTAEQLTQSLRTLGHDIVDVTCTVEEAVVSAAATYPELVIVESCLFATAEQGSIEALLDMDIPILQVVGAGQQGHLPKAAPCDTGSIALPFGLGALIAEIDRTLGRPASGSHLSHAAVRTMIGSHIVKPLETVLTSVERMSNLLMRTTLALDVCRDWIASQRNLASCPAAVTKACAFQPDQGDETINELVTATMGIRLVIATAVQLATDGAETQEEDTGVKTKAS